MKGLVQYINESTAPAALVNKIKRIIKGAGIDPTVCPDANFFADEYPTADINVNELESCMDEMLSNDKECYVINGGRGGEDIAFDLHEIIIENVELDVIYENDSEFIMEYGDFGNIAIGCASYGEDAYWMIFV